MLLEIRELNTYYGTQPRAAGDLSHGRQRGDRRPPGPKRHGEEHDPEEHHGPGQAEIRIGDL